MTLKESLQILIPTYNRSAQLQGMLETLLADSSPVKNCEIKIIDNASTDNTAEICKQFSERFANVRIVRNRYNLGLSGNFIKAMTLADKKYFWIIFDNDKIDFTHWAPLEKALLSDHYDFVLTTRYYLDANPDWAQVLLMMIYLPAFICKTEHITSTVLTNAYHEAYTMHPQMALISKLVNENKRYFIPDYSVWSPVPNPENPAEYTYDRLPKQEKHFRVVNGTIMNNLLNTLQSIKDSSIRNKSIDLVFTNHCGYGPYLSIEVFLEMWRIFHFHYVHLCDAYINGSQQSKKSFRRTFLRFFLTRTKERFQRSLRKKLNNPKGD